MKFRLGRRKPKDVRAVLRGWRAYLHLLMLGGVIAAHVVPARAELPVPCGGGSCGGQVWVAAGRVQAPVIAGDTLRITQESDKAILNWASFNIGRGQQVQFAQPSSSAVALNRIHQIDPSRIDGRLSANGQIYLINQNGIVFGNGAQVNVNSLTASTLDVDDKVFIDIGLARALDVQLDAAFKAKGVMGGIRIEQGAELKSADGGRIMILAPVIDHAGKIETPNGQAVLAAAKDKVYLATSDDPNLRGLLVEVAGGGELTNSGTVTAPHGNVSMLGFAINQNGVVSASTGVRVNGSIRLLAREVTGITTQNGQVGLTTRSERDGVSSKVSFGANSVTEVLPDLADKTTAVDDQAQQRSSIDVLAKQIGLGENALIHAPSGKVTLTATNAPDQPATSGKARNDSRIELAPGSRIDVAGTTSTVLPMERNQVSVELRANELRDSPLQRDGVLRGEKVVVDVRKGTPLADVSGAVENIERDIGERSSRGGDVYLTSEGDLVVRQGAVIDVSGGSVRYEDGYINTTKLLTQGKLVDIGDADPNVRYDAVLGQYSRKDPKWGVTQNWTIPGMQTQGVFEAGYIEGAPAGTINLKASALRLDGELRGGAQAGPYQRDVTLPNAPVGGALTLDLVSPGYAPTLRFGSGPALTEEEARRALDPSDEVLLSPEMLQRGGLSALTLKSAGIVDLPAGTALRLPAGGRLSVDSDVVQLSGTLDIPSGRVAVDGTRIILNDGARIDVRGSWVNDNPLLSDRRPSEALLIDGGVVALSANGDLLLRSGSVVDAGGGAWADSQGRLHEGRGGTIALKTDFAGGSRLEMGAELRAYAAHEGGVLDITANSLRIDRPGAPPPSRPDPYELVLTPDFFQRGGFRGYRLNANLNSITLAGGTELLPRMQNIEFELDYAQRPSGSALDQFTRTVLLRDDERAPVDLSLSLYRTAAVGVNAGRFEVQEGSVIRSEPGATVRLTSDASLIVNGRIEAPAGEIALTVTPPDDGNEPGYLAGQGIWLGPQAQLLAPAQLKLIPDDQGLRRGEWLPGGDVILNAKRGYIVTGAGSVIDVSGDETQLDVESVPGDSASSLAPSRKRVTAAAGAISFSAAEGMLLDGDMRGHAPADTAAGSLRIELLGTAERDEPATPPAAPARGFLYSPHRIELRADGTPSAPAGLQQGGAIADAYNGRALLDARLIRQGGFDDVLLRAHNTFKPGSTTPVATGEIRFGDGVDLQLARGLVLDAPGLRGEGQARLAAPYVTLGNSNSDSQQGATSSAGDARLQVDAGQAMEIVGALGLRGFGEVHLNSGGDLRLRGVQVGSAANELAGSLDAHGLLALRAAQIYPSTLSRYRIEVGGDDSRLVTARADAADTPILSAGGELTLRATRIEHGGVLKAPMGSIRLQAEDLRLLSASKLSVSAEDQDILFGVTQFGVDWLYGLRGRNLLFGATADPSQNRQALPEKRIELNGRAVSLAQGATLDVSGGGDLLAYEFIPGPGGSRDVLAADQAGGSFAILPRLNNALAPYDPMISADFTAEAGVSVHLTAGAGVPAGDYTILPARYALLPGAYLVTPVANTRDIQPGMPATRADDTPIVAGYYTIAGTDIHRDGRWQGFVVETSDVVKQRAEYKISPASRFFAEADGAAIRLPQDAGRVQIQTIDSLLLAGQLRSATGPGGRGSVLDISAADIRIVAAPDPTDQTSVQITAAGLNQLNADSLLIGGRRSADGSDIEVEATTLRVTGGAELQGREIVLTATQGLTLEDSARIDASGAQTTGSEPLHVSGDSAVLRAASGTQRPLSRSGSPSGRAMLNIEAGARVGAAGSLLLDSSGDAVIDGDLAMQGGSLAIGAAHIDLGDAPRGQSGVVLRQAQFDRLQVDELILRSGDGIDIYGNLSVNARRLAFDTAGLYGRDNAGASVLLKADEVRLGNDRRLSAPDLDVASDARLVIDSPRLLLSGGDFAVQGYGVTQINAAQEVYFGDDGHVRLDGDLKLNVAGIGTAAGADVTLDTQGALNIAALTRSGDVTPPGLGARLEFNAQRIVNEGRIVLPAGELTMNGRDGVTLAAGSLIDVSGTVERYADQPIAAPAGRISLASAQSDVVIAPGARLDMRAAAGGDAGELHLSAPTGTVQLVGEIDAHADAGRRGGRVGVDVDRLGDFSAFNDVLDRAGFSQRRELHVRQGDVTVAAGDVVRAKDISMTVDGGGIDVQGALISEAGEGRIALHGRDDVSLAPGALLRAVQGHVELGTTQGKIALSDGARIDVAAQDGGAAGEVHLRAPRVDSDGDGADDDVAVEAIGADVTGAARFTVEALRRYVADAIFDTSGYRSDAEQYMARATAIETRLGAGAQLQAGVELASEGNLSLLSDWDLASWRYEGRPGVLTLRAAGNLYLGANLSDGFDLDAGIDALSGESIDVLRSDASWSYRLAGGADLASADPLATRHDGDVIIGAGMRVRTGTGAIDVAAGGDVVLADGQSTLYTAGVSTGIGTFPADYLSFLMPGEYPAHGGDLRIAAGGDVRGALPTQFITDWLHRMGGTVSGLGDVPTVWSIDFERYRMGIGALGGGDVVIEAGGAVSDLAVMLPTTGQHRGDAVVDANGGLRFTDNNVRVQGGGDLAIDAGGDIRGGVFYLGRGQGEIRSGGAFMSDSVGTLYPILALAEGKYDLTSRGEINLETAVNPTLWRQGVEQDTLNGILKSNFFTYGPDSGVTLTTLAGDIRLRNDATVLFASSMPSLSHESSIPDRWAWVVYPGSLRARALQGDIEVNNSFTLFPSARGTLELLAEGNVSGLGAVTVNLSDTDPAQLPGIARPSGASLEDAKTRLLAPGDPAKLHAATPVHQQDDAPARIVAANGDVAGASGSHPFALYLSKPVLVSAGGDVRDISLNVQNLRPTDVSVVQAGRDIRFSIPRNSLGQSQNVLPHLQAAGPGRLDVLAGRDIDLGTSDGIVTIGNGLNPMLPPGGAEVVVQAGVPLDASYDGFINRYLIGSAEYRGLLADYMRTRKADPAANDLDAFVALPREQQRAMVMEIFFRELQASGRKAANSGNSDDYRRGYDAIATLYPPSDARGDLRMYFSRIHTVAGGGIYLGVPAGMIDAGVAAAVGFTKSTDQLGIVALRDGSVNVFADKNMMVNQSRVFAMDGGDILIWSSRGDIDAGRGAKTALAAPSSRTDYDRNGNAITTFPPTVSGSGIRAFVSTPGRAPGDVDLFAPIGIVNAGDAGIGSAGNVTIGAVQVLGADNIDVGGIAVGVPLGDTNVLGGALASLGDAVSAATKSVEEAAKAAGEQKTATPMSDAALRFLEVEVTGFGEEGDNNKKK